MEVKLWCDNREREMYKNFSELFAIIKATEKLEKAYVGDTISPADYESESQKLIAHFKTLSSTLKDITPSIEHFSDTYQMDYPAALNRLVTGIPATVEHRGAVVVECVQSFITSMDSLKLNLVAVDEVHPLIYDLYVSLVKLSILLPEFEGKMKMREWIARLSKMGADEELTEQQARNLFKAALSTAGTNCWLW